MNNFVVALLVLYTHHRGTCNNLPRDKTPSSASSWFVDFEEYLNSVPYHGNNIHRRCSIMDIGRSTILSSGRKLPRGKVKCPFKPSLEMCWRSGMVLADCLSDRWFCGINKRDVCDGISLCLMDECNCDTQIFYCSDGFGCVHIKLVCDGVYDCIDRSDELMCDGLADFNCTQMFAPVSQSPVLHTLTKYTLCDSVHVTVVAEFKICDTSPVCRGFSVAGSKVGAMQTRSNIELCTARMMRSDRFLISPMTTNLTQLCLDICKGLVTEYRCQRFIMIDKGLPLVMSTCPLNTGEEDSELNIFSICDGYFDCADSSDEIGCEGRFYCDSQQLSPADTHKVTWVPEAAKCDGFKDCHNGLDECSNCPTGMFSSSQFIIKNSGVFAWLILSCVTNLVMNIHTMYKEVSSKWEDIPRYVKVDRILKLQLCFYDLLLGIYLFALVIANLRYHKTYCFHDHTWRSSWVCKCLGILYNASSHGSLLTVFLMSLTRAHKCFFTYSTGTPISLVLVISGFLALLNIANAVVPIIPTDGIQSIFRVRFAMSQSNPFIMKDFDRTSHVSRLYNRYFGENDLNLDLYQKIDALKAVTNQPSHFDFHELSYYSWSSVCVNDIFGYKESMKFYKVAYITCICSILLSITVFYTVILRVFIRTRQVVNQPNAEDDKEFYLKVKVILMIGSKLLPWLTIIGAIIYYNYTRKNVPEQWYQVTAICIIPANSLLNPIFNSNLLEHVTKCITKITRLLCPNDRQED